MSCTGACNANQGRGKCPGGCFDTVSEFEDSELYDESAAHCDCAYRWGRTIAIVASAAAVIVCIVLAARRFA